MMSPTPLIRLLPLLALLALPAHAEDPAPAPTGDAAAATAPPPATKVEDAEQQLATELRKKVKDSEIFDLKISGKNVLTLFKTQTKGQTLGAVVLLHDLNSHPDWPDVISPLRKQLPDAGWHTLTMQLPHADSTQASVEQLDTLRRYIDAALSELEKRSVLNVVLIGHGQGAHAAVDYMGNTPALAVQGLILIGMDGSQNDEPRLDPARSLSNITVPILDIYGERDYHAVVNSAKRRYELSRQKKEPGATPSPAYSDIARDYTKKKGLSLNYRQVKLSGADHHFKAQSVDLVKRLRGWLKRYAAGTEITSPQ